MTYTIEPMWEPDGEGLGWVVTTDDKATAFCVCENASPDDQHCIATFSTRNEAETFIADEQFFDENNIAPEDQPSIPE